MDTRSLHAAAGAMLLAVPAPAAGQARDAARYSAADCASRQGAAGRSTGGAAPPLARPPRECSVGRMTAFREGKRPAATVHPLPGGYV